MKKDIHIKLIVSLVSTLVVAGVAGFLLLRFAAPQHYFAWYPVIPAYFILLCVVLSVCMERLNKRHPDQIVAVFFAMRAAKIVLLLVGLLLYYKFVGTKMIEFSVTTLAFFVIYRIAEIRLYCDFQKNAKHLHE